MQQYFFFFFQAYFPRLCIKTIEIPGNELGELGENDECFIGNQRIEGNM